MAAYLRVSSKAQTVSMQRDAIDRAARARGEPVELWLEETRTGGTIARPELARLVDLARGGRVRLVYVFRLDRLTRTGIRDTLDILHLLKSYGCRVETIADGFSLEGPGGELVTAVLAYGAQMERLAIRERIAAARVRVEAAGGSWGRARRMTDELAEKAVILRVNEKRSIRYIAQALKVPRATVARELDRCLKKSEPESAPKPPEKPGVAKVMAPPSR